jgi:hypothetical protein
VYAVGSILPPSKDKDHESVLRQLFAEDDGDEETDRALEE